MKILISNIRYFISGGPEKYLFNISKLLEQKGNEVIPFSIKYNKNEASDFNNYFITPIGDEDKVYYREYKKDFKTVKQLISRSFYSFEAKNAIMNEIEHENPDIIYMLPFINKISPSIIDGAKNKGKKVVVRLSDFFLMCPRFDFLCNNEVCEKCTKKGLLSAVHQKCVGNSFSASFVRVMSMYFHRLIKIYDKVDKFICPTTFLADKLVENGFDKNKIVHIPTFIDYSKITPNYKGEYILYFGRLCKEKGIDVLIEAFSKYDKANKRLLIVGDYNNDEGEKLINLVNNKKIDDVEFLGFRSGSDLLDIIQNSKFVVVPSRWYDNMPNVLLEAYACGKPVIASRIGSFTELIDDGKTGFLFDINNVNDLIDKIKIIDNEEMIEYLGKNARKKVEDEFNADLHYKRLIEVFRSM